MRKLVMSSFFVTVATLVLFLYGFFSSDVKNYNTILVSFGITFGWLAVALVMGTIMKNMTLYYTTLVAIIAMLSYAFLSINLDTGTEPTISIFIITIIPAAFLPKKYLKEAKESFLAMLTPKNSERIENKVLPVFLLEYLAIVFPLFTLTIAPLL